MRSSKIASVPCKKERLFVQRFQEKRAPSQTHPLKPENRWTGMTPIPASAPMISSIIAPIIPTRSTDC
jgi:hypothetical protein